MGISGGFANTHILIQELWGRAWDSAFPIRFRAMPTTTDTLSGSERFLAAQLQISAKKAGGGWTKPVGKHPWTAAEGSTVCSTSTQSSVCFQSMFLCLIAPCSNHKSVQLNRKGRLDPKWQQGWHLGAVATLRGVQNKEPGSNPLMQKLKRAGRWFKGFPENTIVSKN